MIRLDRVSFWYSARVPILKDFSLTIRDGERVCLSGRSGIGKSTILRLVMGLEKPRRGQITRPEGLRISAVFQEDRLIPWKTVSQNIALFAENAADAEPDAKARRIRALLSDLMLEGAEDKLPAELSGGMKRRVALARALLHPSELLILDEAFAGLDDETKAQCLSVTDREAAGRTVLLTAHDMREAERLGARIADIGDSPKGRP